MIGLHAADGPSHPGAARVSFDSAVCQSSVMEGPPLAVTLASSQGASHVISFFLEQCQVLVVIRKGRGNE